MLRVMRSTALALTLLVLASGTVHARPLAAHPAPSGFLDVLWQWVISYVPGWAKEGGMMDSNGYTTKSGGMMDPDGVLSPKSDSGSSMDPNGARPHLLTPPPTSNAGGEMDPDG